VTVFDDLLAVRANRLEMDMWPVSCIQQVRTCHAKLSIWMGYRSEDTVINFIFGRRQIDSCGNVGGELNRALAHGMGKRLLYH